MSQPCAQCDAELCLTHCVYCGVDCSPALGLDHRHDCPRTTGLYPTDLDCVCTRCGDSLDSGYVEAPVAVDVVEIVCIGCAAPTEF